MEFVRKVVNGSDLKDAVEIPESLVNRKVEILIFPIEETSKNKNKSKKSLSGFLSKYANPTLIKEEENIWYKEAEK